MQPIAQNERYAALDVVRGIALFGVLMVNLLWDFRAPLFQQIVHPDSSAVMWFFHTFFEFKSMDLFCLTFGCGIAIQFARTPQPERFLARRFLALMGFGLVHMLLIWNGDILTLYAIAGMLLIPTLRLPSWLLAIITCGLLLFVRFDGLWPSPETIAADIRQAQIYSHGSWMQILQFRTWETAHLFGPLILMTLPKTLGLMLLGIVIWRTELSRRVHPIFAIPLLSLGHFGDVPLALGAAILLFRFHLRLSIFAWPGRMAFTNYLSQSVILSAFFYAYGLGLFGKLTPASAAPIGIALYIAQIFFSRYWLQRHAFGPMEYAWRRLSYGSNPFRNC